MCLILVYEFCVSQVIPYPEIKDMCSKLSTDVFKPPSLEG